MGSSNTKVQCILRPGQSGKTRKMVELIKDIRANFAELVAEGWSDAGMLNIFVVSNVMALADQTTKRMQRELYDDASSTHSDESDEGVADAQLIDDCFAWTSGSTGVKVDADKLFSLIVRKKVSTIVLCANKRRLGFLKQLIDMLNDFAAYRDKIHMWIDEADASINLWGKPAMDVTTLPIVQKVTLVSATFNSIIKQYGRLRILGDIITHPSCYHKVADCVLIEDNCLLPPTEDSAAVAYLSAVLPKHPEMCAPGARLFAPGDYTQASHDEVASYLVAAGFAVLVLNGIEKAIRLPNGREPLVLDFKPATPNELNGRAPARPNAIRAGEELGVYVARLYHANGLAHFPFAVTGHLCVGRGLTFQNENFLFDFGILPFIRNEANAYQAACRMAGNIRNYLGYKPATLVTTTKMWDVIRRQEGFAVNLARIVKERNLADVGAAEFDEAAGIVGAASVRDYALSPTFATSVDAAAWCDRNLSYGKSVYGLYDAEGNAGLTHIKYRTTLRALLSEAELRASVPATNHEGGAYARVMPVTDVRWGVADSARVMPVARLDVTEGGDKARVMPVTAGEAAIVWIAIYKKDKLRAAAGVSIRQFFGRKRDAAV
jgi:hypothetical protein